MRGQKLLLFSALTLPLLLLTPATSEAQRGRGGRAGARVAQPVAARPVTGRAVAVVRARPVYGRHYVAVRYRPFFYGGYGYYPYYSAFGYYGWGPYGYPGYPWYPPFYAYGGYDYVSRVRVQVTPKIAEVYVDGFRAGIADDFDGVFQRLRLEPGAHELVIYLEGHRSIRHQLYLTPGDEYKIREVMEPLGPGQPAEARPVPTRLPDTGRRLRAPYPGRAYPGAPRVRERVPGEAPAPRPEPDEALPPDAPEGRMPGTAAAGMAVAEGFGSVVVRVQPSDAEVYIDGERWRTPEGADEITVQLAAGPHRVEVRKAGYRTFAADVVVAPGAAETINVSLPRGGGEI